jgi:uncharacterized protein YndB with AHSA1/START domain
MMDFVARILKVLVLLVVLCAVVLWFAARRTDRGYIEEEVRIDRPVAMVFRWITTDELMRRWISDLIKLEKTGAAGAAQPNNAYRVQELIANQPATVDVRILRVIPNQELDLALKSAPESADNFSGTAEFKLFPNGDYTRVVFTSRINYENVSDQFLEPVITYIVKKKVEEDLSRLKLMSEAETATTKDRR